MGSFTTYKATDAKRGIDYIGVTVVFYCHDGKGRLLMHKRSQHCRDEHGRWDVGGGALEHGESFEEGVTREIQEEYCTTPKNLHYIDTKNVIRPCGDGVSHWVAILFMAEVDPEEVANGDPRKIEELGWFAFDQLPEPLHSKFPEHFAIVRPYLEIKALS